MAGKRDRMIELFYQVQEANDAEKNVYRKKLDEEKASCGISNISKMIDTIEQSILVNHVSRDQTVTPAKRKLRKNGKIVYKDLSTKEPYFVQGDCIRGQLHDDTFLSAIKPPKYVKDDDGNYKIEKIDGKTVYEKDCLYVVRRELHKLVPSNNPWTWKKLEDEIVNKELYSMIRNQFPKDVSFKEAVANGIYMLDKNGNKIHRIRHIRCITTYKYPLEIKQQTYKSKCEYKQHYYANNGKSAYLAIYWDGIMGNKKDKEVRNLLEVVKMKETSGCISIADCFEKSKKGLPLYAIIRPKTRVIIFDEGEVKKGVNAPSEMIRRFKDMETNDLHKRLYVVNNFEKDGRTILVHHNEARPDTELGKGSPKIDLINPNPKDRVSINKRYMLVEGVHFTMNDIGEITFIKDYD
jgi:CRISPR-associated endonuclease Csn1